MVMITTTSIGSAGVSVADDETNTCIDIKNKIGVVGGWFRAWIPEKRTDQCLPVIRSTVPRRQHI